ncbi:MAG: fluoride efflux transporter CrcB [Raineya sp.]|jgi:CrcB protein|nr:fluoride efflux transporter CrcB [Raineya sp.]
MWKEFLWVFVGGGVGSVLRYGATLLTQYMRFQKFPYNTLIVNIIGAFLIGLFFGAYQEPATKNKLIIVTGFLGGFTTFSAFSYETFILAQKSMPLAILNILANVFLTLLLVWAGYKLAS